MSWVIEFGLAGMEARRVDAWLAILSQFED